MLGIRFTRKRTKTHAPPTPPWLDRSNLRASSTASPDPWPALQQNLSDGYFLLSVSSLVASEDVFPDRSMDPPIGVNHLGDPKIGAHRHQRDRLVLAQFVHGHQEAPQFAERVAHRPVQARMVGNLGLGTRAKLRQIIWIGKTVD